VLAALVAPLVALFVVNIVFPFLAEGVFFAGLRAVDPARADALAEGVGGHGLHDVGRRAACAACSTTSGARC
jgi:hypothetical protein